MKKKRVSQIRRNLIVVKEPDPEFWPPQTESFGPDPEKILLRIQMICLNQERDGGTAKH